MGTLRRLSQHRWWRLVVELVRPALFSVGFLAGVWAVLNPGAAITVPLLLVGAAVGLCYGLGQILLVPQLLNGLAGRSPVVIEVADLFDFTGSLIVGVTEYFDTRHGPAVERGSTHGILITRLYDNDFDRFQRHVDAALAQTGIEPIGHRPSDGRAQYPIGTVAVLDREGGGKLYLVALAHSDPTTFQAYSDLPALVTALCRVWASVEAHNSQRPVALPLLGAGLARIATEAVALELAIATLKECSRRAPLSTSVHIRMLKAGRQQVDFRVVQLLIS